MNVKATTEKATQLTFTRTSAHAKQPIRFARLRMMLSLAFTDAVTLLGSCAIALFLWTFVRDDLYLSNYVGLIPLVLVFLAVYFFTGLYSDVGINPVEELRLLTIATSVTFLGLATLSFWFRSAEAYSRASFILGWLFSLVLIPSGRELLRSVATKVHWWGEPVAIIGFGDRGAKFLEFLQKNPRLGFNPVVLINGLAQSRGKHKQYSKNYPLMMVNARELVNENYGKYLKGIQTAIVIQHDIPGNFLHSILQDYGFRFSNLILISNTHQFASLWVIPLDIGGVLGLRVRQNLMSWWQKTIKRTLDLTFIAITSPLLLPIFGLISLVVWASSSGGIFYSQKRIGQGGKTIRIWKFRTMVKNADEVLERHLEQSPKLKKEWDKNHKLKGDPRVTRVGRFLRKSSLDELPQVWNILRGEMSLVGPRPIIDAEVRHYGDKYKVYLQVKPGITGLWQVSGRNNLNYATRVRLDEYYVRNWSVWFDLHIIARTPWTIITGTGAY